VPPAASDFGVGVHAGNVLKGNFEGTFEGPELVGSAHVEDEIALRYR
jgi:hypothetical protein